MANLNTDRWHTSSLETGHKHFVALLIALLGVALALPVIALLPKTTSARVAFLALPIAFIVAMRLRAFQCLPLLPKVTLILIALRPLMDAEQSALHTSSSFSPQNLYAALILALLLISWWKSPWPYELWKTPNRYVLVLLGMSLLAWLIGGLDSGANSFSRTVWGLMVALLLGPLFRTEKQIDVFIRTVFYSSAIVLAILALHIGEGLYQSDLWRLGGQYSVPNTLAGVAFSLFACGLYVRELDRTQVARVLDLSLLGVLAIVIVLTQSQTVGALMVISACLWFWAVKRIRALYLVVGSFVAFLMWLGTAFEWRLASTLFLKQEEIDPGVLNLTGRTYVWGYTLQQYLDAGLLHKTIGLGWGKVVANFEVLNLEFSNVTENSFLWFLVGTGIIGLLLFSAYLVWLLRRSWVIFRRPPSEFDRRLALLAFVAGLTFLIEGFTTDLALSPVVSCYLYAILSIFVYRSLANARGQEKAAQAVVD